MAGKKIGAEYSTGASAVASRKSYNKKRLAEADEKRRDAKRRKAEQKKRDDQKKRDRAGAQAAAGPESHSPLGDSKGPWKGLVNDTNTQQLLAQVVVGTAAGATVPTTKVAAVREPELSEGEVEEDESVSLVVPAASNVPIGKSDWHTTSAVRHRSWRLPFLASPRRFLPRHSRSRPSWAC